MTTPDHPENERPEEGQGPEPSQEGWTWQRPESGEPVFGDERSAAPGDQPEESPEPEPMPPQPGPEQPSALEYADFDRPDAPQPTPVLGPAQPPREDAPPPPQEWPAPPTQQPPQGWDQPPQDAPPPQPTEGWQQEQQWQPQPQWPQQPGWEQQAPQQTWGAPQQGYGQPPGGYSPQPYGYPPPGPQYPQQNWGPPQPPPPSGVEAAFAGIDRKALFAIGLGVAAAILMTNNCCFQPVGILLAVGACVAAFMMPQDEPQGPTVASTLRTPMIAVMIVLSLLGVVQFSVQMIVGFMSTGGGF